MVAKKAGIQPFSLYLQRRQPVAIVREHLRKKLFAAVNAANNPKPSSFALILSMFTVEYYN